MSDPYVPGFGGFTNEDYSNYLKAHEGIANLFADKDAIAEFLERNRLEREEFIDEYIDELYGPGRMDYIRQGLKDGLKELGYQVAIEVGTHYGSAGAGWIGGRILSWTAKRFKSMWSAWRGSRVVGKALQEGTEAAAEQLSRSSKGTPGPTPMRTTIQVNKAAGDAWEAELLRDHLPKTQTQIQPQITIRSGGPSGKKVRVDAIGTDTTTGGIKLTDGKASATAPLTPNQEVVYPELEIHGGTVVGKGKPPYGAGTRIPPTAVDIIRKD
jgi:filamentous hemagglutinin